MTDQKKGGGEELPRMLMGVNGKVRWQGASGASYDTKEEAEADVRPEPPIVDPPPVSLPPSPLGEGLFGGAQSALGGLVIWGGYLVTIGQIEPETWWLWFFGPVAIFFGGGMVVAGVARLHTVFTGQSDAEAVGEATWNWWMASIGGGLLKLLFAIIAAVIVYFLLSTVFEGVSKGTAIIILLLFAILIAIIGNTSGRSR